MANIASRFGADSLTLLAGRLSSVLPFTIYYPSATLSLKMRIDQENRNCEGSWRCSQDWSHETHRFPRLHRFIKTHSSTSTSTAGLSTSTKKCQKQRKRTGYALLRERSLLRSLECSGFQSKTVTPAPARKNCDEYTNFLPRKARRLSTID